MSVFIGVDPGKSGAIAVVDHEGKAVDWCAAEDPHALVHRYRELWHKFHVGLCVVEKVSAMPKQGVSSTFKFGWSAGMLEGFVIFAGWRYTTVSPSKWQGVLNCRSKGDKNVTKSKASQLFPSVKMTHRIADAFLLAEYARQSELCMHEKG
jgi:crossover junction endodeoxyribonuclease RuvC